MQTPRSWGPTVEGCHVGDRSEEVVTEEGMVQDGGDATTVEVKKVVASSHRPPLKPLLLPVREEKRRVTRETGVRGHRNSMRDDGGGGSAARVPEER